MKTSKPAAPRVARDVCAEITAKLVAQLEAGTAPWVQPWSGGGAGGGLPRNAITGKHYRGGNVVALWSAGFADPRWLTFKQAIDRGGNVRRGEKGSVVCFWTPVGGSAVKDATDTEEVSRKRLVCRAYTVFNVSQCENLRLDTPAPIAKPADAASVADGVVSRVGAFVSRGGDRAAYSPRLDQIVMPAQHSFTDVAAYDATLLHELTHWTGHKSRLDRDFSKSKRFGDDSYAFEELVAEVGSAFACARLGVDGQLQHASYLATWVKVLRADKHAIFTAAREAEKACDLLVPASADAPDAGETEGDVAMAA